MCHKKIPCGGRGRREGDKNADKGRETEPAGGAPEKRKPGKKGKPLSHTRVERTRVKERNLASLGNQTGEWSQGKTRKEQITSPKKKNNTVTSDRAVERNEGALRRRC